MLNLVGGGGGEGALDQSEELVALCLGRFTLFFHSFWGLVLALPTIPVLRVSAPTLGRRILVLLSHLFTSNHHWNVLVTKDLLGHASQYFLPWAVHTVAW